MFTQFYIGVAILLSGVACSGHCSSDDDCYWNFYQTSCCAGSLEKTGDYCSTWCDGTTAANEDTIKGAFGGFDSGALGTKYTSCAVNQISGESNLINNFFSAHTYGSRQSWYQAVGQVNVIAKRFIELQNGVCESFWDTIFGEVETLVKDVFAVLDFLCKYEPEIAAGETAVGWPEAAPITKEVCTINGEAG